MTELKFYDKEGKELNNSEIIQSVALHIHYDLSLKAIKLMDDNKGMKVSDFREIPEVKKLWSAMDIIKENYLPK